VSADQFRAKVEHRSKRKPSASNDLVSADQFRAKVEHPSLP
jgi:stalled ribosome alternative rescue factor ArfA